MVTVDFGDGRAVEYDSSKLELLDLAYATTIHKSQGAEYDSVIVSIQNAHAVMLTRPLLYTAITRAKKAGDSSGREESPVHGHPPDGHRPAEHPAGSPNPGSNPYPTRGERTWQVILRNARTGKSAWRLW